jgi:hypothetical protein
MHEENAAKWKVLACTPVKAKIRANSSFPKI